ncbi:iron-sulfur cluster assembly scaffold protein [Patescibacteria group bacterium]|nr:iron-sulfur cluster assembly scaffold protein [Patescibacteria group bacterium]
MLDLITHYYDNPINRRVMEDASASHHEGNSLCGDDITVYIKLSDD